MKYVDLLLFNEIKPVLVFDGRFLPSKAETEKKRRENRTKYRKMAKDHLLAGQYREGWHYVIHNLVCKKSKLNLKHLYFICKNETSA